MIVIFLPSPYSCQVVKCAKWRHLSPTSKWSSVALATSTLKLSPVFILLLLLLFLHLLYRGFLSSTHLVINGLPRTIINPNVPKNELIRSLTHPPISKLLQNRLALFHEACNPSLVQLHYVNLPLVGRKDTAIKPAFHKLSEDICTIISCIHNKETIPRTLFKNGKRSKSFFSQVSQASLNSQTPLTSLSGETSPTSTNSNPPSSSSVSVSTHSQIPPTPSPMEPNGNIALSSGSIADFFISRELNQLKDEIRSMKANIAASKSDINHPAADTISNELMLV